MTWEVQWSRRALRVLGRLDRPTRRRIVEAVEAFADYGRGDVKRLKGSRQGLFRLRVGDWRILFSKEQQRILLIRAVRIRGDAY